MKAEDWYALRLGQGWEDDRYGLLYSRASFNVETNQLSDGTTEYINVDLSWYDDDENGENVTRFFEPELEVERRICNKYGEVVHRASITRDLREDFAIELCTSSTALVISRLAQDISRVRTLPNILGVTPNA